MKKIPIKIGSIVSLTAGIINFVLILSTDLHERAYTWPYETLLNLFIGPGIYASLALDVFNPWDGYAVSPWAIPIIVIINMAFYFGVGYILGLIWKWIKKTS